MNLEIIRAYEEDASDLIEARNKSFYDDFVKFGECPGYNIPFENMVDKIRNLLVYKILIEDKIIGDISVKKLEEGYYWIKCLENIPEYQNKGIGSKVLSYIETQFPDAKRWGLDTPVQNERNCRFYEKMGFIKVEDKEINEKLTLRVYNKRV